MKKLLAFILCLVFAAAAAEGTYDLVQMNETLETITETRGEPLQFGEYLLLDDALFAFYESGRLKAKCLVFEKVSDAAALTEAGFDAAKKLKQGAPLEKLVTMLGEGREIMRINLSDEDTAGERMVLAWKNADGTVLEALLEKDGGAWVLFALTVIET